MVFSFMSQIATVAPDCASRLAMASPMPDAPPVTMALRPFMSSWFIALPLYYWIVRPHGCGSRTRKSAILIHPAHPGQTHFLHLTDYTQHGGTESTENTEEKQERGRENRDELSCSHSRS